MCRCNSHDVVILAPVRHYRVPLQTAMPVDESVIIITTSKLRLTPEALLNQLAQLVAPPRIHKYREWTSEKATPEVTAAWLRAADGPVCSRRQGGGALNRRFRGWDSGVGRHVTIGWPGKAAVGGVCGSNDYPQKALFVQHDPGYNKSGYLESS